MNQTKNDLRKEYRKIREKIDNKKEKSNSIFEKIKESNLLDNKNVIAIYYSMEDEVYTLDFIEYLLSIGKTIVLPKVIGNNMKFFKIKNLNNNNFKKSRFGVLEPIEENMNFDEIELMIVPGICFDKRGYRIGYGKGFYDRYLLEKNIKTIGVCFDECLVDFDIPIDGFDRKVDYVFTEKGGIYE